jgi:hypothetical protein
MAFGLEPFNQRASQMAFFSIAHHTFGWGVEEIHVHLQARISQTNPNFAWVRPFEPRPPQYYIPQNFVNAKNTESPKILGTTNRLPIIFALPIGDLVGG